MFTFRGPTACKQSILRSVACLVDNIFVLVLADRSVFHTRVMLSDNRVSLDPNSKQMDIENLTLFPPSGVNFPFTKTDCPVKQMYFCVCWKYFGNSLRRSHKIKGEMRQYNKFPYLLSLLVENRLKIIVIVREHGKGIRASFPLLLLWFCQCSSFCPWFFADFVKVKKIAVLYIKHTCTRTINLQFFLQDPPVFYREKRTNIATENLLFFLHFELHAFYGDVLTLKNAEIRDKGLFDSTAENRFLRLWWAILIRKKNEK